jgi:hypothetical protein
MLLVFAICPPAETITGCVPALMLDGTVTLI